MFPVNSGMNSSYSNLKMLYEAFTEFITFSHKCEINDDVFEMRTF